ncbi:hypothetical protein ACO0LO_15385 [Undibacterium sp. TJN25]|uniref:hypothetical protein n=1 Tax=Undibacterium sp. TJN25 TaxID=3413056 RepID=UPI003BF36C3F
MNRYEGKPFLRLLECYILSAIGHLDEGQRAALQAMEPKLAGVYQTGGTWLEIVGDQMDFPETLPQKIREIWESNLAKARQSGMPVDPTEFAMAFVDQNFPDIG